MCIHCHFCTVIEISDFFKWSMQQMRGSHIMRDDMQTDPE